MHAAFVIRRTNGPRLQDECVSDLLHRRCVDAKAKNNEEGCYCVGGRPSLFRCDSVALTMCWASVMQSDGRHMCSGSRGEGGEMGLSVGVKAAAGAVATRVKAAGFLSFARLA